MKNITILFNTYPVAFDCPGGGEIQLLSYLTALNNIGVTTLLFDPWNPKPQFEEADVVHYFSVQGGSWPFCHYVRNNRKIPLVISPIIWIDDPAKYGMPDIKYTLDFADHILPNSQAECEQQAKLFNINPCHFTPIVNGVDSIFFEPATPSLFRNTYGIHEPFVLCMGNIEARKNQLRLIQALQQPNVTLVLAGNEREQDYAAQCRAAAGKNVHFIGALKHGSVLQRSMYKAAEALVLPSTLETPGLAALEAAAAGSRIAITTEGCTKEYFADFAEYLNPYDLDSIRNATLACLAKPKPEKLPHHIQQHFTWEVAAKQLLSVYTRLLAEKGK